MTRPARVLLWALLVGALVLGACAVLGLWLLASVAHGGMSLHINGEPVDPRQLPAWQWWAASGGGVLATVLLVVALPLSIGLLLALAGLGLSAALAAVLLIIGVVLAAALWPLLLAAALAWWWLRRKRSPAKEVPQ
ncbi:MAG: hypothetical protein ABIR94_13415 [Rubrivivax sp.]